LRGETRAAGRFSSAIACAKLPAALPEPPPCARSRTVQKQRASKRPVGKAAAIIDNSGASWSGASWSGASWLDPAWWTASCGS
jgi:hypothetical protein